MTARTVPLVGAPTWFDLSSSEQARSQAFYSELFGWEAEAPQPEMGGYAGFRLRGERIAGCMPNASGMADAWTTYFAVDDAEKTAALVAECGGTVHAPAMDVADLGRMAVVSDPGGSAFGLWQPGTHLGFGLVDEPGAPSWFELHTLAYDAVLPFYAEVLGWDLLTVSDVPGFRYTVAVVEGQQVVGVMDATGHDGVTPAWEVYVHCDDVAATQRRGVALGGAVVHPAEETPYGVLGSLTDPTGALVKLRRA